MLVLTAYLIIYFAQAGVTKTVEGEYPSLDACREAIKKNTFRRPAGNNWTVRCSEDLDPPWERNLRRLQDPPPIIR